MTTATHADVDHIQGLAKAKQARMAATADRHRLYELSVQCVEAEIDFVDETYRALRGRKARLRLSASAWQPSLASRAKAGAGGGTRTHTTLPSRDFKSLASTSSATSALVS